MKKTLLMLLFAFTAHAPANAVNAFKSGNSFFATDNASQISYVIGVVDAVWALNAEFICLPKDVSAGQLTDVVRKHLNEHPETRHKTAASLIIFSLMNAFPCK